MLTANSATLASQKKRRLDGLCRPASFSDPLFPSPPTNLSQDVALLRSDTCIINTAAECYPCTDAKRLSQVTVAATVLIRDKKRRGWGAAPGVSSLFIARNSENLCTN